MAEGYTEQTEPSRFIAHRLDAFMHLFSFVRNPTDEEVNTLPRFGFRLTPNPDKHITHTMGFTLNGFPYFMLNRVFPYLHYYHDYSEHNEIVLTIIYFDFYINYVIDVQQMQLACPVNLKDLQSCKEDIKNMLPIINLSEQLVEICINQPVFPREHMKEYL